MTASRTVMFGVGATKAGTSWLHRYLSDHPQCDLPAIKELHYFDRIGPEHLSKELSRLENVRANLHSNAILAGASKAARLQARVEEIDAWIDVMRRGAIDPMAYRTFLNRNVGSKTRLVGDITPAYGLLSEKSLVQMADIAPDTRFVMLLRDPLDRLWSNLRMMAGWRLKDGQDISGKANALFDRMLRGKETPVIERSDYAGMLNRLQNALPENRLHVEFYECLFTQTAVDRLCAFLGIDPQPGAFDRRIHASPSATLETAHARNAAGLLLPHYDYVLGLMGELPDRWQHNRDRLS